MVVEANVGVNKVNYATKRELVHDIAISDEGKISEVLTYTLKNTVSNSPTRGVGAGGYALYLQILLPIDVTEPVLP